MAGPYREQAVIERIPFEGVRCPFRGSTDATPSAAAPPEWAVRLASEMEDEPVSTEPVSTPTYRPHLSGLQIGAVGILLFLVLACGIMLFGRPIPPLHLRASDGVPAAAVDGPTGE